MSEITNGVRVLVREKPSAGPSIVNHCDNNLFRIDEKYFSCDRFFETTSSQVDVYTDIKPLIEKFIDGYGCTVLAYGQSGTGKSYTMGLQSENVQISCNGIVPRALEDILDINVPDENTTLSISFLEIYNEKVFDLLSETPAEQINSKGSKFTCRVKRPLRSLFDAQIAIIEGNKNRHVRPTPMNNNSSRSHGIFIIQKNATCLYMVDLAGSEGVRRTGHKGEALAEGSHINRGLLGIGNILKALSDGNTYIPYRDTVLGSVLQDSLSANSFLTLVVCISGNKEDESETTNSLSFAQKVMKYKICPKVISAENKKRQKADFPSNFETPLQMKRPLASSTGILSKSKRMYPPMFPKSVLSQNYATPASVADTPKVGRSSRTRDAAMSSPSVLKCLRAMNETLQKRNLKIESLNFTAIDDDTTMSESDNSEINLTVIENCPMIEADSTFFKNIDYIDVNSDIENVPRIKENTVVTDEFTPADSSITENVSCFEVYSNVVKNVDCIQVDSDIEKVSHIEENTAVIGKLTPADSDIEDVPRINEDTAVIDELTPTDLSIIENVSCDEVYSNVVKNVDCIQVDSDIEKVSHIKENTAVIDKLTPADSDIEKVPHIEENTAAIDNFTFGDSSIIENVSYVEIDSAVNRKVPTSESNFMTREECMKFVQHQINLNLTRLVNNTTVNFSNIDRDMQIDNSIQIDEQNNIDNCKNETFQFKVPEVPRTTTYNAPSNRRLSVRKSLQRLRTDTLQVPQQLSTNIVTSNDEAPSTRRRSIRLRVQNLFTETIEVPQHLPPVVTTTHKAHSTKRRSIRLSLKKRPTETLQQLSQPPVKRKKTVGRKKAEKAVDITIMEQTNAVSNDEARIVHSKFVLNLLNTGSLKDIQILPQVGMKTAYGIITQRSINGAFKSFHEVSQAPFWRGKAWERFKQSNNLI